MNEFLHRKNGNPLPECQSMSELAEAFSDYFVKKISDIRLGFSGTEFCESDKVVGRHCLGNFTCVSESDVKSIVCSLSSKSCVLDPVPTFYVKKYLNIFLPIFTKIVNESLQTGIFPSVLKNAVVFPLLKKQGLECTFKNYRPVSNLAFV